VREFLEVGTALRADIRDFGMRYTAGMFSHLVVEPMLQLELASSQAEIA
jgi:hypothetical protein